MSEPDELAPIITEARGIHSHLDELQPIKRPLLLVAMASNLEAMVHPMSRSLRKRNHGDSAASKRRTGRLATTFASHRSTVEVSLWTTNTRWTLRMDGCSTGGRMDLSKRRLEQGTGLLQGCCQHTGLLTSGSNTCHGPLVIYL